MNEVMLFDIQRGSTVDGPGMRTVVFFKGCNLRCGWCHNPESQRFEPQVMFEAGQCIGCGSCKSAGDLDELCPTGAKRICGKLWSTEEVMAQILSDRTFYEKTGGGVTFSGGECMLQPEGLLALLRRCKEENIHTAIDTAGHIPWEVFQRTLPLTDLYLYDIKCIDSAVHRKHTGVDNKLILENLQKLLQAGKDVILRLPIVSQVNDDPAQLEALLQMIKPWGKPKGVELLPCHTMGAHKYTALGLDVPTYVSPSREHIQLLQAMIN